MSGEEERNEPGQSRATRDLPVRPAPRRFSLPHKPIPTDLLDGIELPSAPGSVPAPGSIPASSASQPSGISVRKPGEMIGTPAPASQPSPAVLRGADLFRKGAELPAIGSFAGYEVLGRLAMGGMAEILLARRPGEKRPIVLKKILATYDRDDEFVKMFLDEARVGMQLDHPNIARFLDAGEEGGRYYIAMEWVNGVTLGKLVRRAFAMGGLPPAIACEIVRQVADALHYAHTSRDDSGYLMGLIHRDVSPHNIMVAYDGSVKLLDFGIAKAMGAAHITSPGVVKGKFAYMSPEQCDGQSINFRSDIFSLGVVLFEALTGHSLYRRDSDRETVHVISNGPVPILSERWPEAPRELEAICTTALSKMPPERFPTAAAMRDVLELFVDGQRGRMTQERIAATVQQTFGSELASGPSVDRAAVSSTLGLPRSTVPPRPTVAPKAVTQRPRRATGSASHARVTPEPARRSRTSQPGTRTGTLPRGSAPKGSVKRSSAPKERVARPRAGSAPKGQANGVDDAPDSVVSRVSAVRRRDEVDPLEAARAVALGEVLDGSDETRVASRVHTGTNPTAKRMDETPLQIPLKKAPKGRAARPAVPPPELDHAWTDERTAVQDADDRDAVLEEIRHQKLRELGGGQESGSKGRVSKESAHGRGEAAVSLPEPEQTEPQSEVKLRGGQTRIRRSSPKMAAVLSGSTQGTASASSGTPSNESLPDLPLPDLPSPAQPRPRVSGVQPTAASMASVGNAAAGAKAPGAMASAQPMGEPAGHASSGALDGILDGTLDSAPPPASTALDGASLGVRENDEAEARVATPESAPVPSEVANGAQPVEKPEGASRGRMVLYAVGALGLLGIGVCVGILLMS